MFRVMFSMKSDFFLVCKQKKNRAIFIARFLAKINKELILEVETEFQVKTLEV